MMTSSKTIHKATQVKAAWHVSDISDISEFVCWYHKPDLFPGFHMHYEIELNLITQGGITYLHGENVVYLPKGSLAIFWAAKPHRIIHIEPNTLFYFAHTPFIWFLRWHLDDDFRQALLNGYFFHLDCSVTMHSQREVFRRWCEDLQRGNNEDLNALHLEVEAFFHRISGQIKHKHPVYLDSQSHSSLSKKTRNIHSEDKVVQMVQFMAKQYLNPITISDVAKEVGFHPNYASTLFKQHNAITINSFLMRLRVVHAQMLLITTDDKILDIAYASGFGSPCRFYIAFKEVCKMSPRAYRFLMRC